MTLVGYWPLNESDDATEAKDHSGNENHGTINDGGDSRIPGSNGILGQNAYQFDGSNDYVESFVAGSDQVTFSAWAKPVSTQSQYAGIIQRDVDSYLYDAVLRIYDSNWSFAIHDGSSWQAVRTPYNADTWQHVAATYRNGEAKIYLNGTLKGNLSVSKVGGTVDRVFIGRYYDPGSIDAYFDGKISELRTYNRALTPSEIQYLYTVSQKGSQTTSKKTS